MPGLKGGKMARVLIACEESQAVCKAFRARGHEVYTDFDSVSKLHVVEPYCPHCDAKVVSA